MNKPAISGIAPLFIVKSVPAGVIMFKDVGVDPVPSYTQKIDYAIRKQRGDLREWEVPWDIEP